MATGIPLHPAECFRTLIQAEPQIESGPANEYAAPAVLEHLPTRRAACATGTDGACYHNPGGSSGCAAIVRYPEHLGRDDEQIVDFGCSESSNNRMELLACIRALRWIRSNSPWPGVSRVQIVTDSQSNAGDPQAIRLRPVADARRPERPPVDLLRPYDAGEMTAYPVDPRVGNVRNNDAALCEKLD